MQTTINGVHFGIREGLNTLGAALVEYYAVDAPGTEPVATVQAAIDNDPGDPLVVVGYVVQGFDLTEPDGHGLWIFDLGEYGDQAFALACQKAIDSIRELIPDIAR